MSDIVFLYVTAPDEETARSLARRLVEEKHAACVNILGAITSIYAWEGAIEESAEIALLVKTTMNAAPAARERIAKLHPYQTPCIAALQVNSSGSLPSFLKWIQSCTNA